MWQEIKNIYHLVQALIAASYYQFPSKKLIVIGITGTDGKTTTVNMLNHILKSTGQKVSSISSINATIGTKSLDTGFHVTTPSPWQVQKYLRLAADEGSKYFILEATSHGLHQNRLAFINFKIAALTNISHEHLDYHKSKKNYLESKAKLFKNVKFSILNANDESYKNLKSRASGKIISYSSNKDTDFNFKKYPIKLKIPGDFNQENALASVACAVTLGVTKSQALSSLSIFKGIPGRLESVDLGQEFKVLVDFAHTPAGLERSLKTLKTPKGGKLIAVFGSAGERDKSKRQLMGKVASKLADISVLTAEDPRSESVSKICDQIAQGFLSSNKEEKKDFYIITDRKKAIEFAINIASNGDIVGLFGKGHEKSMNFGKKEIPWNEVNAAKEAIKQKMK